MLLKFERITSIECLLVFLVRFGMLIANTFCILGIKVIGGCSDDAVHGIFIKRLLKDGKALTDGKMLC